MAGARVVADVDTYAALNEAITREMGMPLVTKWMILGELVDDDGDRRLFHVTSEHCLMADQLGLLAAHEQYTQARRIADLMAEDD